VRAGVLFYSRGDFKYLSLYSLVVGLCVLKEKFKLNFQVPQPA